MIRLTDAVVLAYTKLRTHRIRTGITVGIAGILFGIILAAVFIVQGVAQSVERFGEEGLGKRALVAVTQSSRSFEVYEHLEDEKFIAEVEAAHKEVVDKKTAVAKKYAMPYDPSVEDPSPIEVDRQTKQKKIDSRNMYHESVQKVALARTKKDYKPFDIDAYLAKYASAKKLGGLSSILPTEGDSFVFMKDGKEPALLGFRELQLSRLGTGQDDDIRLMVLDQSVADPFINKSVQYDAQKGEIPVILPLDKAEKALGLKKLGATATTQQRYDRLAEVRSRIGEVTASFCYRNAASQQQLGTAIAQRKEIKDNADKAGYIAPKLQYAVPSDASCGAVSTSKDTRTAAEKKTDESRIAYEKELGIYIGEPKQHKVTVRAIGVSGSSPDTMGMPTDVAGMVYSLLSSQIGYGQWVIPSEFLKEIPAEYRPEELFGVYGDGTIESTPFFTSATHLVEFGNLEDARAVIKANGTYGDLGDVFAYPFGSSILVVEELKDMFAKAMLWALAIVGGVAIIILGSVIGRTVSEGRRESAVFRAIGARRSDIGSIYGMYSLLLSLRVALFAVVLGAVLALALEVLLSNTATIAARFAYAAVETDKTFHFFGIGSWYIPLILGAIIVFGMIASIIPVIRSARRNPINDMRDDT